jgi:uncharacterized protein YoxC
VARNIIIAVLAVAVIVLAVLFIMGRISERASASRIIELEDTIDKLRESDKLTQERYQNLEKDNQQLRSNNERFKQTVESLEKGVGDADDAIRKALESSRRLEKIHKQIGN